VGGSLVSFPLPFRLVEVRPCVVSVARTATLPDLVD
jgi:hypothetical protein